MSSRWIISIVLLFLVASCARPVEFDEQGGIITDREIQNLPKPKAKSSTKKKDEPSKSKSIEIETIDGIADFEETIIRVLDGDTPEIMYHGLKLSIRMKHIDAPEIKGGQPYSKLARRKLSELCLNKKVRIVAESKPDRFGRLLAELYIGDMNINKEMVRLGLAWHFKIYSNNQEYARLENEAKKNKIGLWQESNPIAPWDWRKGKR